MNKLYLKRKCDICKCIPEIIIDGQYRGGRWAWQCPDCRLASNFAGRFGVGVGQAFFNRDMGPKLSDRELIEKGLKF